MARKHLNIQEFFLSYRQRVVIIVSGLVIGVCSLLFTNDMAATLRRKEQNEVTLWTLAVQRTGFDRSDPLVEHIISQKNNIPLIVTDNNLRAIGHSHIPDRVANHPDLMRKEIEELSSRNRPLEVRAWNGNIFYFFYGESRLLKMLVYFPLVQIVVIIIFIFFGYITFRSSEHDEQNRVWIGLAKETAHQLGTPTSSLLGWMEYLRGQNVDRAAVEEMMSDLKRLMKVVDRFSKIGSQTVLAPANMNEVVGGSVQYFQSRIPRNVTLSYNGFATAPLQAAINSALFEWVVENLLKNALDALQGRGEIDVRISDDNDKVYIDVTDTGRGIAKANFKRIFEPGYTTKTRGWGLGLSLSRRIIEEYHKGKIYVPWSEPDKGTTIRISLKKSYA